MAAKTDKSPGYFVAVEGFVYNLRGKPKFIYAGRSIVTAEDPAYKARPRAFRPLVEQTTAAPGELR